MGKATTVFTLIISSLLISFIAVTEGLDCYSCWSEGSMPEEMYPHPKASDGIMGHKSCQRGSIPHPDLAVTCPSVTGSDGNEILPVCIELYANFTAFAPLFNRRILFTLALRGCFHANSTVEDLTQSDPCSRRTYRNLADLALGDMRKLLDRVPENIIPNGTTGELCYCKEDKCNGASSNPAREGLLKSDGGIIIPSLAVLIGLSLFAYFY